MWQVTGRNISGERTAVRYSIFPYRGRGDVRDQVKELMGSAPESLLREFEIGEYLPGVEGVETWGGRAVEVVGVGIDGSGLRYETNSTGEPTITWLEERDPICQISHTEEVLAIDVTGLSEIELTADHQIAPDPSSEFPDSFAILDWRAYLGSGTLTVEGDDIVRTVGEKTTFSMRLMGAPGVVIGRIVGWLGKPKSAPRMFSRDPFLIGRLNHFEQWHTVLAKTCPDIGLAAPEAGQFRAFEAHKPAGAVLVFVHGTFSCALPNLAQLDPLGVPTYRFEHDTFLPFTDNASKLAGAVKAYVKLSEHVHLVAHSRGGLVARLAARELHANGFKVELRTFGTPHQGTPLANAGGRLFSALLAAGRTVAKGAFSWDPASIAGKLLLKGLSMSANLDLPAGLRSMQVGDVSLEALAFGSEPFGLQTYGGTYDLRKLANGACAYALGEIVHGAFRGEDNDLVVPTASAIGAGTSRPVFEPCTHFDYFSRESVQTEIRDLR